MSDLSSPSSHFLLNPKPDMDDDSTQFIDQFESEEDLEASANSEIYITSNQNKKSKKLSNEERQSIFESLFKETKDDKKLKQGTIAAAATYFSVSRRTIVRIWKQAKECMARGVQVDVSAKRRGRVGRKRREIDFSKLEKLPDCNRPMNIRELAKALNASKSLIHRRLKEGAITPYFKRKEYPGADDIQAVKVKLRLSVDDQDKAGSKLGQHIDEKVVPDYYKILQVDRSAKNDNLKKAYRKLAIQWHPDKNTLNKNEAETMYKQISEAFDILSDPKKRTVYNQYNVEELKDHVPSTYAGAPTGATYNGPTSFDFNPRNPDDIYKEFFGFSSPLGGMGNDADGGSRCSGSTFFDDIRQSFGEGGENQTVPQKAPPIENTLPCSLEELYNGTTKRMKISRVVFDKRGKTMQVEEILTINIRPGWKKGTKITFSEKGNEQPNIIAADLVYIIDEKPHSVFTRDGNDLVVSHTISLTEALTGCTVPIKTLDGRVLLVPVNSVTQVTHEKIVPKEGMCILKDPTNRGNLRIKFNIKFPMGLTAEQKAGIRKYLPP